MTNAIRVTIGAEPGEVARVGAAFDEFADAHALPAGVRRSVSVALDELLTNTVMHGLGGREAGEVTIDVELRPDLLTVTLTQQRGQTLVGWRQLFDSAEHQQKVAPVVSVANEQNLDRLAAEVRTIP